MSRRQWVLATCIFLVVNFSSHVRAQRGAIVEPRNLAELTDRAATIVLGRIIYSRVEPHPQYHNLNTVVVTMSVEEVLKGTPGRTLTYRQFIWDPRDPADHAGYVSGKEVLVFLNPVTSAGFTSPVGLSQGRFEVLRSSRGEPMAVNGVGNKGLLRGMEALTTAPGTSPTTRRILAQPGANPGPLPLQVLKEVIGKLTARPGRTP